MLITSVKRARRRRQAERPSTTQFDPVRFAPSSAGAALSFSQMICAGGSKVCRSSFRKTAPETKRPGAVIRTLPGFCQPQRRRSMTMSPCSVGHPSVTKASASRWGPRSNRRTPVADRARSAIRGNAMTAAAMAAVQFACDVCGSEPCLTPGFCQTCRAADARVRQQRPTENASRPTPRTTIEAIVFCVRERGPQALHEQEPLSGCSAATPAREPKSTNASHA